MKLAIQARPVRIVIVGLGGTGGYVFYHLCRLVAAMQASLRPQVVLADGDIVEEKNLLRQNFVAEDIGRFKVQCLAERYGNIYDLNIPYFPRFVEDEKTLLHLLDGEIAGITPAASILLGAVDNNRTRRLFHEVFYDYEGTLFYIDSGNSEWAGQVILGLRALREVVLPPVGDYYPDMWESVDTFPSEMSCSERAVSSPQNIATNALAGTLVFGMLNQLLAGDGLSTYGATFDARTGQTRTLWLDDILKDNILKKHRSGIPILAS